MHPFDTLTLPTGHTLIFTPCPGTKGNSVSEAIAELKQGGALALITMMPQADLEKFEVTDIPAACQAQGIDWVHLPVEDDEAPEARFEEAWQQNLATIDSWLANKTPIALHCKGGTGRTSLIGAILMQRLGYSWEDTVAHIRTVRPTGVRIPKHVAYLQEVVFRNK